MFFTSWQKIQRTAQLMAHKVRQHLETNLYVRTYDLIQCVRIYCEAKKFNEHDTDNIIAEHMKILLNKKIACIVKNQKTGEYYYKSLIYDENVYEPNHKHRKSI